MSDELVKRISDKWEQHFDLCSDLSIREIIESAIREALEEILTKVHAASYEVDSMHWQQAMTRVERLIRERAKAPAETEGTNG